MSGSRYKVNYKLMKAIIRSSVSAFILKKHTQPKCNFRYAVLIKFVKDDNGNDILDTSIGHPVILPRLKGLCSLRSRSLTRIRRRRDSRSEKHRQLFFRR